MRPSRVWGVPLSPLTLSRPDLSGRIEGLTPLAVILRSSATKPVPPAPDRSENMSRGIWWGWSSPSDYGILPHNSAVFSSADLAAMSLCWDPQTACIGGPIDTYEHSCYTEARDRPMGYLSLFLFSVCHFRGQSLSVPNTLEQNGTDASREGSDIISAAGRADHSGRPDRAAVGGGHIA